MILSGIFLTMATRPFSVFTISFILLFGLLVPVKSQSENVCSYQGGWSLRVKDKSCPMSAPVNCGTGAQTRCCANGLVCVGEGDYGGNYCCKEGEDCRKNAESQPRCPDPTWTLWGGNGTIDKGAWCCEPGFNGFYRGNMDAVGCTSAGVRTLPTSLSFASTVRTVACVQTTSASSSSSNIPSTSSGHSPTGTAGSDNSSPSPPPPSSSISGAAIAGIVVGVIGGLVFIAAAIAFMYRMKRKNKAAQPIDQSHHGNYYGETAKLPMVQYGAHAQTTPHELASDHVHELGAGESVTAAHRPPPEKSHEMP